MSNWMRIGRTGPFLVLRNLRQRIKVECFYRGQPTDFDSSIALAEMGTVQLELIQQHTDCPSVFREIVGPGEIGFHHIGVWAEEYEASYAQLQAQGSVAALEGTFGGSRFAYFDFVSSLGCMLELTERTEAQRTLYQRVADIAKDWDGSDPIRPMM